MACHLPFNISHDSSCLLLQSTFTFHLILVSPSSGITTARRILKDYRSFLKQWLILCYIKSRLQRWSSHLKCVFFLCLKLYFNMVSQWYCSQRTLIYTSKICWNYIGKTSAITLQGF